MPSVVHLARFQLRRSWRAWLGLTLLLGLVTAASLGALAGARRTASAYPRLVEATNAFDVLVNPDDGDMDFDRVARLSQVEDMVRGSAVLVMPATPEGLPDEERAQSMLFFGSHDPRFVYELNRLHLTSGRLPDAGAAHEVAVDAYAAEDAGVRVGDRIPVISLGPDEGAALMEGPWPPPDLEPLPVRTLTVVGVGLYPANAPVAKTDVLPVAFLTPAFMTAYDPARLFTGGFVRLRSGPGAADEFVEEAQRVDGEPAVYYQTQSDLLQKARKAVQPYWGALALFGAAAALAGGLIALQALSRQLHGEGDETPVLRALGMTRLQLVAAALGRVGLAAVLGAAAGAAGAWALSAFTPIGPGRPAEPDPGRALDAPVMLGGAALVVLVVLAAGAWAAWRVSARASDRPRARTSVVAEAVSGAGFPPTATAGVHMALQQGSGRAAVPVRATITGAALSVGALAAALTFAASLDRLVSTPRLYGADWDLSAHLIDADSPEQETGAMAGIADTLADDERVDEVAVGHHLQLTVNGVAVPGVALQSVEGDVWPTVVEGRAPRAEDEVLLGTDTLRRAGADVGDAVTVATGGGAEPMQVVGRAVFPRFSAYPGADKTGLGVGAALTARPGPQSYRAFAVARFGEGAGGTSLFQELRQAIPFDDPGLVVAQPERPDEILGYEQVDRTPLLFAGLLAVLAGATTAHALVSSVRRRRRELAVLKVLGFVRRQVRATVAWQATTVAVAALLLGLPLGVAAGRWMWVVMADRMHAVAQPVVPALAIAGLVPATLILANLVATLPAAAAGATRPATALRTE